MSLRERFAELKKSNKGYTLAELLAVMAIMGVLAGLLSFSIVLIFSRDAEVTAKKINDVVTDARLYAMSKDGEFAVTLTTTSDGKGNSIKITCDDSTGTTVIDNVVLTKQAKITFGEEGSLPAAATNSTVKVTFNKKGMVKAMQIGGTTVSDVSNKVYQAHCVSNRNSSKSMDVFLVTSTGRHYVE